MNREEYFSADWAKLDFWRTKFHDPYSITTAFNVGQIVPLQLKQIYPGDEMSSPISFLIRSFTPIAPVMSDMYLDVYSFFIPHRLNWTSWEEFCGQNNTTAWTESYEHTIPQAYLSDDFEGSGYVGSIGDLLGLPEADDAGFYVSDLPRRAYLNVYNEWFRDENIIAPILYSKGDEPAEGETYSYASKPLYAAKFHDYFTSLLPEPMKGTPPTIGPDLEVHTKEKLVKPDNPGKPLQFFDDGYTDVAVGPGYIGITSQGAVDADEGEFSGSGYLSGPANLWAKMSITIEDIRNAAAVTHVLEKLGSSGSRYPEFLKGIFGVTSSDARLQIPEYLGGQRFRVNMSDIVSNADTVSGATGAPLGTVGAMSKTGNSGFLFHKAFTEHGYVLTVGVVRVCQDYFQGLDRHWTDKCFFDFYMPQLANIGNQPVYLEELNALAEDIPFIGEGSDKAFRTVPLGYAEAWAHLRYTPNKITSIMKPTSNLGLQYYNASDIIPSDVALNQEFIEMRPTGYDRCLAIPSVTRGSFQFYGNFYFANTMIRILPPHSEPGLTRI